MKNIKQIKFKHFYPLILIIVFVVSASAALPPQPTQPQSSPTKQIEYSPPSVHIKNLDVTQSGNNLIINFDIINGEDYDIYGVAYNIDLIIKDGPARLFIDKHIPSIGYFTLLANSQESKIYTYLPTSINSGVYTLRVTAVVGALQMGWQDKQVEIVGNDNFLEIDPYNQNIIYNNQEYAMSDGVIINPGQTVEIKTFVGNPRPDSVDTQIKHKITKYGERTSTEVWGTYHTIQGSSYEQVTFNSPILNNAGSYLVESAFYENNQRISPLITSRIIVAGDSSTILSIIPYQEQDNIINVEIKYVGPADFSTIEGYVKTEIEGISGTTCGTQEDSVTLNEYIRILTHQFTLPPACQNQNLQIRSQITDTVNQPLFTSSQFTFQSQPIS